MYTYELRIRLNTPLQSNVGPMAIETVASYIARTKSTKQTPFGRED